MLVVVGVHAMLMSRGRGSSTSRYGLPRSLLVVVILMRGRGPVRTRMRMMSVVMSGHLRARVVLRTVCHNAAPLR